MNPQDQAQDPTQPQGLGDNPQDHPAPAPDPAPAPPDSAEQLVKHLNSQAFEDGIEFGLAKAVRLWGRDRARACLQIAAVDAPEDKKRIEDAAGHIFHPTEMPQQFVHEQITHMLVRKLYASHVDGLAVTVVYNRLLGFHDSIPAGVGAEDILPRMLRCVETVDPRAGMVVGSDDAGLRTLREDERKRRRNGWFGGWWCCS